MHHSSLSHTTYVETNNGGRCVLDYEFLSIAQACDRRTAVGLARCQNVDPRFFRRFPKLPDSEVRNKSCITRSVSWTVTFLNGYFVGRSSIFEDRKISLPPATKLGEGYVFTGICDSVNRGGVCLSACWDTPLHSRPPGADSPQEQTPPPEQPPPGAGPPLQSMLGDTVNARTVRILLECNLVT